MRLFQFYISLFFISAIVSCNSSSRNNEKVFNAVMDVHDEVMPKMGELVQVRKQLEGKLASAQGDSLTLIEAISGLDESDEAMMNWMREFDIEKAKANNPEAKGYLKNELDKVNRMRDLFLKSLESAKKIANQK